MFDDAMEKQVVRFARSTTIKDDICYKGENFELATSGVSCHNCRVHMLTDRFLSRHFQEEVMHDQRPYPQGKYPYVIIVDTSRCNMRCRACYSWKYWEPEQDAYPAYVGSKSLARQFGCKIEKLHDEDLICNKTRVAKKDRPFSRNSRIRWRNII